MRCIWHFKDTNSKANHNYLQESLNYIFGVFDISKIQIQKQITTYLWTFIGRNRCIWHFKDTNSKANHNPVVKDGYEGKVYLTFQRYKFKSKSQRRCVWYTWRRGCIWHFKDTNSKANHNTPLNSVLPVTVYLTFQRYKFKSKSQRLRQSRQECHWCIWHFKDTNSKANHNAIQKVINIGLVYLTFQRYKFKSKSQLLCSKVKTRLRCIWHFKDTNSKANHNNNTWMNGGCRGVFDISKIQIQKQITTDCRQNTAEPGCIWYFNDVPKRVRNKACFGFYNEQGTPSP